MRITYSYQYFPDCPEATEYSKSREFSQHMLMMSSGLVCLMLLPCYFIFTARFFGDYNWAYLLLYNLSLVASSYWLFYTLACRPNNTHTDITIMLFNSEYGEEFMNSNLDIIEHMLVATKRKNARLTKTFFTWYGISWLGITSLIAIFRGVYLICHRQDYGIGILLGAIVTFLISIFCCYKMKCQKQKSQNKPSSSHASNKSITSTKSETIPLLQEDIHFCHNCGKELSSDSIYCSVCGTKVR